MDKNNYTKNLVKNTIILSLNKIIAPIVSFLLLPIYTNNISTSEYGTTDVIQTYIALLVPILLVRLDIGMFRFLVEKRGNKKAISEIVTNTIAITAPTITIALLIMVIASVFNILPYQAATIFYFLSIITNNITGPLVRGLGKNTLFAVASITEIFSNLICSIVFVLFLQMGGLGLIISWGISSFINNIICIIGAKSEISFNKKLLNKSLRKELIKLSAPIIADGVSFWVINTSDRTIITMFLGASANGIYAIANKFSNIVGLMTTVFWMSWNEQASIAIKEKYYSEFVTKIFDSYFRVASSIATCLIAIIPFLFKLTINADYGDGILYIPFLILGLFLNSLATFYGPIYLAHKKSKEVAISTSIAAIINLAVDLILAWFLGIWAAVISTIIAYLFILIYRYIDIRKMVKIHYDIKNILTCVFIMAIIITLYYTDNLTANLFGILISISTALFLNRHLIVKYLSMMKRKVHSTAKRSK